MLRSYVTCDFGCFELRLSGLRARGVTPQSTWSVPSNGNGSSRGSARGIFRRVVKPCVDGIGPCVRRSEHSGMIMDLSRGRQDCGCGMWWRRVCKEADPAPRLRSVQPHVGRCRALLRADPVESVRHPRDCGPWFPRGDNRPIRSYAACERVRASHAPMQPAAGGTKGRDVGASSNPPVPYSTVRSSAGHQ